MLRQASRKLYLQEEMLNSLVAALGIFAALDYGDDELLEDDDFFLNTF